MTDETKVSGETQPEVDKTTLGAGGVTEKVMPTNPPVDADVVKKEEVEALKQKYETDLRKLQSSLQRNESELRKALEDQKKLHKDELERARIASMDDDERKVYEVERNKERLTEMQELLNATQLERDQAAETLKAYNFFQKRKVPADVLVVDQGYEALLNSGWEYITNRIEELEKKQAGGQTPTKEPPKEPPKAPPVDTTINSMPIVGTTWEELEKRYGSRERVYQLIEEKRLKPDVLPK